MASYRDFQREVRASAGFLPKTCWIADVLERTGKKLRVAPNRINYRQRRNPCPVHEQAAIIAALRKLQLRDAEQPRRSLWHP